MKMAKSVTRLTTEVATQMDSVSRHHTRAPGASRASGVHARLSTTCWATVHAAKTATPHRQMPRRIALGKMRRYWRRMESLTMLSPML